MCVQNAEVTRQMTVARAAQDEVEEVRREMQEKVKVAQETADRQVEWRRLYVMHSYTLSATHCRTTRKGPE